MRFDRDAMARLLKQARDAGATSIHLKVPGRVSLKVNGLLVPVANDRLLPVDTRKAVQSLMGLGNTEFPLATLTEQEFGVGLSGVGRFRVCAYKQRGSLSVVIHRLATEVEGLESLGLTASWGAIGAGLTLVGGRRRSDLCAAVVNHQNAKTGGHIVLLEDAVHVLHADRKASISQREIGIDTESWQSGLRSALRQAADIIVLSEVTSPEVASMALTAAERGVKVVVCVPGRSPSSCVDAFVRMFGEARALEAHQRVAEVLSEAMCLGSEGGSRLDAEQLDEAAGF
jgi:Tfp pilus assembly pilus retraction ATPase PilT